MGASELLAPASRPAALGALALLATACGAHARTEAELNEAFARIQVGEARVVTSSLRARDASRGCPSRGEAACEVCAAAEDVICAEAAPLGDRDADSRCDDARDACADARAHVRSACRAEPARSER